MSYSPFVKSKAREFGLNIEGHTDPLGAKMFIYKKTIKSILSFLRNTPGGPNQKMSTLFIQDLGQIADELDTLKDSGLTGKLIKDKVIKSFDGLQSNIGNASRKLNDLYSTFPIKEAAKQSGKRIPILSFNNDLDECKKFLSDSASFIIKNNLF